MLKCSISQARRFGFILFFTNIYDIFIHTPVIKSNSHVVYEQHQCCQNICWRWKTTIPLVLDIKLWNISRWMLTPQKPHKYLTGCLVLVDADRHVSNVWQFLETTLWGLTQDVYYWVCIDNLAFVHYCKTELLLLC